MFPYNFSWNLYNMSLGFTNILQLMLVFQSSVFGAFLITQGRGKKISNSLLAGFLFILAIHMGFNLHFELNLQWGLPDITNSFGFLYGPILYLYITSLIYRDFRFKKFDLAHLAPWLIILLVSLFINLPVWLSGLCIVSSILAYLVLSLVKIKHFHRVIKNTESRFSAIALIWMQRFIYGLFIIVVIDSIHSAMLINSLVMENIFYGLLIGALLFFVTSLVFNGLRQPEIFLGLTTEDEDITQAAQERYAGSKLQEAELAKLGEEIDRYFHTEKPYEHPELSIQILAEQLGQSAKLISEVINRHFGQNFSEYVNSHRIEEAKKLIETSDHKTTILEILYAVGFNSKSSFYTAFKQYTGKTPSEYKKQINS